MQIDVRRTVQSSKFSLQKKPTALAEDKQPNEIMAISISVVPSELSWYQLASHAVKHTCAR